MNNTAIPRIDWPAIRAMVEAPAYFERVAVQIDSRGRDAAEAGAKRERSRERVAGADIERLPDPEIERLNAQRRRNGGEVL